MNKKGAEFTIGMLIAIVLGVLVLAVIALGFIYGWNNLWGKFNIYGGSTNSVSGVSQVCQVSCAQSDRTGFCMEKRSITGIAITDITNKLGLTVDSVDKKKTNTIEGFSATRPSTDDTKNDWTVSGITCTQLMSKNIIAIDCTNIPSCTA